MSTGECRFCSADRYRDSSYGFRSTQQLAEAGYAVSELERAVLLVPSAFARELFEPEGITFTEVFSCPRGRKNGS